MSSFHPATAIASADVEERESSEFFETLENVDSDRARRRYVLEDTGFTEVPPQYRKFYRKWQGPGDLLAPNEVLCPVCKVVIRSSRELRPGDRVYCMPCMSRLTVVRTDAGTLEGRVTY